VKTFGSVFAGIAGFDLGFRNAGMASLWACEIDDTCNAIRRHHWPDETLIKDVRDVSAKSVQRPDVICGGFPCQDVSVAGRRAGLAGERSGLFFEFMRIVGELSPDVVLIENVPGLLSSNGGRDFGTVLGCMAERGYGFAYRILDSQYFGVPQRRRRVFIVGCAGGDWRRAAEILFEPEGLPWDSPPSREAGAGVTACVIKGAAIGRKPEAGPQYGEVLEDGTTYTLNCTEIHAVTIGIPGDPMFTLGARNRDAVAIAFDTTQITSPENYSNPQPGEPCHPLASGAHPPAVAVTGFTMSSDPNNWRADGMPPLIGRHGDPGNVAIGMAVRRLTPLECERLQAFPDHWTRYGTNERGETIEISDSARYRCLGNAVTVSVAEWIAKRILEQGRESAK
jgi:DNA (cytosine-5)-methyltransferase 1